MAPWPWKRDTVKKCPICEKHIDETEQIKVDGDGVHIKKTYYCSNDCWKKRGLVVGSKLGLGCPFYNEARMCRPLDVDHPDASEYVPCSLRSRPYTSCNVYPILETRRRNYERKMNDRHEVDTCCLYIKTHARARARMAGDESNVLSSIEYHLARIVDINTKNLEGYTVLHWAARKGYPRIVKMLLNMGADVNAKTYAIKKKLTSGNVYEEPEYSVLDEALREFTQGQIELENRREVVKLLLNSGAEVNPRSDHSYTPLYSAVSNARDTEVVKQLIARGAEVNPTPEPSTNYTLLMQAIFKDEIEIVQQLLEAGADLTARDFLGCTALHHAVDRGQKGIVKLLVDYGADVNAKDDRGRNPIECAKTDEIRKLLEGSS